MDTIKYQRGMVFIVYEEQEVTDALIKTGTRIICKTRPYILLSPTEYMASDKNPIFIAAPITSNTDYYHFGDVKFSQGTTDSRICPNQLKAIDRKNIREYMFMVSDEILNKVSEAVMQMCGLIPSVPLNFQRASMISETNNDTIVDINGDAGEYGISALSPNVEIGSRGAKTMIAIKDEIVFIEDSEKLCLEDLTKYYGFGSEDECKKRLSYVKRKAKVKQR